MTVKPHPETLKAAREKLSDDISFAIRSAEKTGLSPLQIASDVGDIHRNYLRQILLGHPSYGEVSPLSKPAPDADAGDDILSQYHRDDDS